MNMQHLDRKDWCFERWRLSAWLIAAMGAMAQLLPAQSTYAVFAPHSAVDSSVQPASQLQTLVTLSMHDSTIKFVVDTLIRQAHLHPFDYNAAVMTKRISVSIVKKKVVDALETVLAGTGLEARLLSDGETVVIHPRTTGKGVRGHREASAGMIVGRVTDSTSGQGLGGASVKIEGTRLSAVTSDSGNFTLKEVPAGNQVLTVHLFGYRPVDRTVVVADSERTTVKIVMASVPTVLSGVVTTATGTRKQLEIGNDVTVINVDSVMRTAPITSVTDLLETRVPGLTVTHTSGAPGAPSRLRLQGAGSIQLNNDPIIVVDGVRVYASQSDPRNNNLAPSAETDGYKNNNNLGNVLGGAASFGVAQAYAAPSPVDQIDPNSIETIEVFKGPSAAAMYGSDAASGVIVITTKHGHAGPTHWSLSLTQGVNYIPGNWPTNYYRFGVGTQATYLPQCQWSDVGCAVDSIVAFQALNNPTYTVFSHGSAQSASLNVNGGVSSLLYSLTGSGSGTVGNLKLPAFAQRNYDSAYGPVPRWMIHPQNYQTWSMNGAVTAAPTNATKVTFNSTLFNSNQQTSSLGTGGIVQLEGKYIANGVAYANSNGFNTSNPLLQYFVERATNQMQTSTNILSLSWQPRPSWQLTTSGGVSTQQSNGETYVPYGVSFSGAGTDSGSFGVGRGLVRSQTFNIGAIIPSWHNFVTLALGGNVYSQSTADFSAFTDQLTPGISTPTAFPTQCAGGRSCSTFSQSTSSSSTYGWYFEPQLNVSSRFFAAPGFRFDGGSGGTHVTNNSSTGTQAGLSAFPKMDFSYLAVDRHGGAPMGGILSLLRLRGSFGIAGTQPLLQDRLRLLNASNDTAALTPPGQNHLFSGGCIPGAVCLSTIGNTQLHPERSRELDGGFDVELWRDRLTMTLTQYNKTRYDAIVAIPVAPSVAGGTIPGFRQSGDGIGANQIDKNVGVIRNTGTEIALNGYVVQSRVLSWNVGLQFSTNNSLVVRLNPGQSPLYGLGVVAGYPLFGQWEYPIVSFADANHDGVIEPNEIRLGDSLVYVGQQEPKYQTDLTTGIVLFGGSLSIYGTFDYQNGQLQTAGNGLVGNAFALVPNAPNTPLATQAAVVAAECAAVYPAGGLNALCGQQSSNIGLMQTVNTFRFNSLSINYQVPRSISSRFRVPLMTIALQGSNLALHTNYRGKDPDVNAFSTVSAGDQTLDLGEIPMPRTWQLAIHLGN